MRSDSLTTLQLVQLQARASGNAVLVRNARLLKAACTELQHLFSHTVDLWNEVADVMAKMACRRVRMAPEALACLRHEAETRLVGTGVCERVDHQSGSMFGAESAKLFWEGVQQEPDPLELARKELKRGPVAVAGSSVVVKVVTVNVLTLHPSEERKVGHNFTARRRWIFWVCVRALVSSGSCRAFSSSSPRGVNSSPQRQRGGGLPAPPPKNKNYQLSAGLGGWAESTGLPSTSHPPTLSQRPPCTHALCARSHKTQYPLDTKCVQEARTVSARRDGGEAWFANKLLCDGATLSPWVSQPRTLGVALRSPQLNVDVLVAHAPVESSPQEVRTEWWRALHKAASCRRTKAPLILLVNANGRLGSICTESVGGAEPDVESPNGEELHLFLTEWELFAANTFWPLGQGTWQSTRDSQCRSDYVCLPLQWKNVVVSCSNETELPLALLLKVDHFVVQAILCVGGSSPFEPVVSRRVPFFRTQRVAN